MGNTYLMFAQGLLAGPVAKNMNLTPANVLTKVVTTDSSFTFVPTFGTGVLMQKGVGQENLIRRLIGRGLKENRRPERNPVKLAGSNATETSIIHDYVTFRSCS